MKYDYYKNGKKYQPDSFIFQEKLSSTIINSIKVCKKTTSKKLNMSCPSEAYINKEFGCGFSGSSDEHSGVKVTIGGANSLAAGYSSSHLTTLSSPNPIKIKYTSDLFKNYKENIKLDSNGNEYINAKVTASKSGYQTVEKTIKIYRTTKKVPKNSVSLTCPSTATLNKEFECKTNTSGVIITVYGAKSLASGYTSSFTTSLLDKTKSIKYSDKLFTDYKSQIKNDSKGEYISAKITASKKGYKTTTKYVKIYNTKKPTVAKTTETIALSCPTSAKVGQVFKCSTNQVGVTITLGGAKSLASGYSSSYTTKANDKSKDIKYADRLFTDYKSIIKKDSNGKEYINAQVTAKKSGYKTVTKNIKIYRNTSSGAAAKPITPGVSESIKTTTVKKITTTVDKYSLSGIWFYYEITGGNKTKTIKIKPTKYGSNVKNDSYVMCETYSDCTNNNAWTNMNNKYKGTQNPTTNRNIARVNKTESVWINTNYKGIAGKKYYLRVTTYSSDNASNWIYVGVFEIAVDSKNNVKATEVYSKFK